MASGLEGIRELTDFELKGKRVFIRVDFNVPMKAGRITDDTRIRSTLPTLKYALEKGAHIVLCSHFGRPKNPEDRADFSLEPIGQRLSELTGSEVHLIEDPTSDAPKALLHGLKNNQMILLENIRFSPDEEKNSTELASLLSSYTDIYINDAFGASHRAHASIVALPMTLKEKGIGFLMKQEISMLDRILNQPEAPFLAILGGAKVSDKIGLIEHLINKVDVFLIGGAMAYTFLAAQKISIGNSKVEGDKIKFAHELLERIQARGKKVLLPIDHMVARGRTSSETAKTTVSNAIEEGWMGLDIGPKTQTLYRNEILRGKTIFWNGPMGTFETPPFEKGSFAVAQAMAENSTAFTVVGGGDSVSAVTASGLTQKMTHISTGGGASLEYLQGDELPGLEVLRTPNLKA